MSEQFPEIFSWFLDFCSKDYAMSIEECETVSETKRERDGIIRLTDELLEPVRRLKKVIQLELEGYFSMRIIEPKILRLIPCMVVSGQADSLKSLVNAHTMWEDLA